MTLDLFTIRARQRTRQLNPGYGYHGAEADVSALITEVERLRALLVAHVPDTQAYWDDDLGPGDSAR